MSEVLVGILTCLAVALVTLLWRNKRRFDRTNEHGVQQHETYAGKLRAEGFDAILLGVAYIGAILAVGLAIAADETILLFALAIVIFMGWARVRRPN